MFIVSACAGERRAEEAERSTRVEARVGATSRVSRGQGEDDEEEEEEEEATAVVVEEEGAAT